MSESPYGRSIKWLIVIMIIPEEFGTARETVRLALEAENIESRQVWKPMHMQPVFNSQIVSRKGAKAQNNIGKKRYPSSVVGGEVAEDLFNRGLCLPSGTAMTDDDLDPVIETIKDASRKGAKARRRDRRKDRGDWRREKGQC